MLGASLWGPALTGYGGLKGARGVVGAQANTGKALGTVQAQWVSACVHLRYLEPDVECPRASSNADAPIPQCCLH